MKSELKHQQNNSTFLPILFVLIAGPLRLNAFAEQSSTCHYHAGTLRFVDGQNKVIKIVKGSEKRSALNGGVKFRVVEVYGCHTGKYGYVLKRDGYCKNNEDDGCTSSTKLFIYDASAHLITEKILPISEGSDFIVTRNDHLGFFHLNHEPFGIARITPEGEIKSILPQSNSGELQASRLSSDGRFAVILVGDQSYVAYDFLTGKSHAYKGPGDPWIKDDGTFEVWVGTIRKDDISRGPDGQKIYEFNLK